MKEFKDVAEFEFKELGEGDGRKGIIEGYAAYYGNVDRGGDILVKGAMTNPNGSRVPLLWRHDQDRVIGSAWVEDDGKGIRYRAELAINSESEDVRRDALKAYALLKEGHVTKNSFGYTADDHALSRKDIDGKPRMVRELKKVTVYEVSIVPCPMNNKADVLGVKSLDAGGWEEKAASGATDLPLADRSADWDGDAARRELAKWASSDGSGDKDKINWSKYARGFFYVDENRRQDFSGYKLPFARPIDGKLTAIPKGIFAAAAALQGARGGVDIPEGDRAAVRRKIAAYYRRMGETPPWSESEGKSFEPLIDQKIRRLIRGGYGWL
mgnify:CR=1 FL=1